MEILYSHDAQKALKSFPKAIRDNILERVQGLTKTPPDGDIKPMKGKHGVSRLRVGKYRILFRYECGALMIDDVGSRGDIYK